MDHIVYMKSRSNGPVWFFPVFIPISMLKSMVPKHCFAHSAVLIAVWAFERLSPEPGEGPSGRGSGEAAHLIELTVTERRALGPSEARGGLCGGVSKGEHSSGGHGHISARRNSRRSGRWAGRNSILLFMFPSSDWAFRVSTQYCVSIHPQLFNIYTIRGIGTMYSMISWHGLCSTWSYLCAFISEAAC